MTKRIIQYSPIRSGSTLLYNILKMLFQNVYKAHHMEDPNKQNIGHIMTTYRHPYDCVVSMTQVNSDNPVFEDYKKNVGVYISNGGRHMFENFQKILTHGKITWFKYEDFVNDFGYIFDKIQKGCKVEIVEKKRKEIEDKLNIERVSKYIQQFKDFSEYSRDNHFHGRHISKDKGEVFKYKKHFNNKEIAEIRDLFMKKCGKNFMAFMSHNKYEISH